MHAYITMIIIIFFLRKPDKKIIYLLPHTTLKLCSFYVNLYTFDGLIVLCINYCCLGSNKPIKQTC